MNKTEVETLKQYICSFLNEYKYDQNSSDCLIDTYNKIVENSEANDLFNEILQIYNEDYQCDFAIILDKSNQVAEITELHEYTVDLLVFICLSRRLKEVYIEKGLPLPYYQKSVADLKYKLDECLLIYGVVGSFVSNWFIGFFRLTRFGIGRLQFEVIPFDDNYNKNGLTLTPETKVINVHIPRSKEPLTEEACLKAYEEAKEFFKDEVTLSPCPFVCHSYLLYPKNEMFLPPETNTYRFFKSFEIISSETDKERKDLWRIFDTQEKNLDRLPADTSMRRAFINYIKNGGKLGRGRGILFI